MIRAIYFPDEKGLLERRFPGSFTLNERDGGEFDFIYFCPCGCGHDGRLLVGRIEKPKTVPSWTWNGSFTEPTLSPSVNHVGHWHGWLRGGYWSPA